MENFNFLLQNIDTLIEAYPVKIVSKDPYTLIQKAKVEIQDRFITLDKERQLAFYKYLQDAIDVRIRNLEILILRNKLLNPDKYEDVKGILHLRNRLLPDFLKWIDKNCDEFWISLNKKPKKKQLTLPEMFKDAGELDRITEQLKKKSFINQEGAWQGKRDPHTGKTPKEKQLAALAVVIEEKGFLLSKSYTDKAVGAAFCDYFQLETQGYYFKFGQRMQIEDQKSLFNFI